MIELNFPTDFQISDLQVSVKPSYNGGMYYHQGINFTIHNPTTLYGMDYTISSQDVTPEQTLEAIVYGAVKMAEKLYDLSGNNPMYLDPNTVTFTFVGEASHVELVPVVVSEEE